MAEVCYSNGRKIILSTEQTRQGTWFCRFTIPGLLEADPHKSGKPPRDAYKSEWDAKTAAFEAAKKILGAVILDAHNGIPGGHHGPHVTQKTASPTNAAREARGKSSPS